MENVNDFFPRNSLRGNAFHRNISRFQSYEDGAHADTERGENGAAARVQGTVGSTLLGCDACVNTHEYEACTGEGRGNIQIHNSCAQRAHWVKYSAHTAIDKTGRASAATSSAPLTSWRCQDLRVMPSLLSSLNVHVCTLGVSVCASILYA